MTRPVAFGLNVDPNTGGLAIAARLVYSVEEGVDLLHVIARPQPGGGEFRCLDLFGEYGTVTCRADMGGNVIGGARHIGRGGRCFERLGGGAPHRTQN